MPGPCRAAPLWLFRERLRIDGAIKTPSNETHTVAAGGCNKDNYSEPAVPELERGAEGGECGRI